MRAEPNLEAQGCECYSPRFFCELTKTVHDLFPGYLLVNPNSAPLESIGYTRGIASLVSMGDYVCQIPNSEVQKIKVQEGADGLVRLPRVSAQRRFRPGDRPKLIRGPFATNHGSTVIYQEHLPDERCAVLLHILGRGVRILVQEEDLVAA